MIWGYNMGFSIIIFALILITIFALFSRNRGNTDIKTKRDFDENIEINEVEEKFFDEVHNGKMKYKFLKIDNQFDLMFVKSLFQSENVPYYVEFENISRMRPGMYIGDLGNYNLLYILEEDYDDALKIIKSYIERKNKSQTQDGKENIRNFSEVLIGNWKVPSANDINGIEIMYKPKNK
jgi:hypothetical protein